MKDTRVAPTPRPSAVRVPSDDRPPRLGGLTWVAMGITACIASALAVYALVAH